MCERTKKCAVCDEPTYGIKCRKCYEKKQTSLSKRRAYINRYNN